MAGEPWVSSSDELPAPTIHITNIGQTGDPSEILTHDRYAGGSDPLTNAARIDPVRAPHRRPNCAAQTTAERDSTH